MARTRSINERIASQGLRLAGAGHAVRIETGRDITDPPRRPVRGREPPKPASGDVGVVDGRTRVLGLDLASTTGWALLAGGQPVAHGTFAVPDRSRNEALAHWHGR